MNKKTKIGAACAGVLIALGCAATCVTKPWAELGAVVSVAYDGEQPVDVQVRCESGEDKWSEIVHVTNAHPTERGLPPGDWGCELTGVPGVVVSVGPVQ